MSEIADNKWELESSKPPIKNVMGIAQIAMMSAFAAFFVYILIFSLIGMVTTKGESDLTKSYQQMNQAPAGGEAPAAAPAGQ